MFNLCLLREGRKHECIDQVDVCEKQIANLQNEIYVLEKHHINEKLKIKMEYVCTRLRKYINSKKEGH